MKKTYYDYLETKIGTLLLAGDGEGLSVLGFPEGKGRRRHQSGWVRERSVFKQAINQLESYFASELKRFDLVLKPQGTEFQCSVWQALQEIPYGDTWSYGQLAQRIGNPKASRAVGAANGKNPIPIIIPCHRVIGSSGNLTGFGGGLETKQTLLALEAECVAPGLGF